MVGRTWVSEQLIQNDWLSPEYLYIWFKKVVCTWVSVRQIKNGCPHLCVFTADSKWLFVPEICSLVELTYVRGEVQDHVGHTQSFHHNLDKSSFLRLPIVWRLTIIIILKLNLISLHIVYRYICLFSCNKDERSEKSFSLIVSILKWVFFNDFIFVFK